MTNRNDLISAAFAAVAVFAPPTHKAPAPIRLYVLDCGHIEAASDSVFHPHTKGVPRKLADGCYLIVHPKGTLMWDTGFPDALAAKEPAGMTTGPFVVHVTNPVSAQLKAAGFDPNAITYLGISHMHGDHVGNVALFPRATLLIQKEEFETAMGPNAAKYGLDPSGYATLKSNPVKKLEGDYNVFGDGSVVIKRTVGHTVGHQALFVELPKTGNILLSGDMAHFADNWTNRRVPAFNYDSAQTVKSMVDMDAFMKAHHATLWIQHDGPQNAALKHAPAYYE